VPVPAVTTLTKPGLERTIDPPASTAAQYRFDRLFALSAVSALFTERFFALAVIRLLAVFLAIFLTVFFS